MSFDAAMDLKYTLLIEKKTIKRTRSKWSLSGSRSMPIVTSGGTTSG